MLSEGDAAEALTPALPAAKRGLSNHIEGRFIILLATAAVLDGAVWLYVSLKQSSLPDILPIHYSSSGQVDRIGFRQQLFILPTIGLLTLLLNTVVGYFVGRGERQLANVLLSITILVQLLLVGATLQLVH